MSDRRGRRAAFALTALLLASASGLAACGSSSKSASDGPSASGSSGGSVATPIHAAAGASSAPASAVPASDGASAGPVSSSGTSGTGGSLGQAVPISQPRIIESGNVSLTVGKNDLQSAFDQVSGLATGAGGFVSSSDTTTGSGVPTASLTLRVPNAQLGQVLAGLARVGTVTAKSLNGQDVTGQVVNLEAQITTLTAEESAVRTILGRATSIGDILQIQDQLFGLETQVQQLTGQQDTLADQTTYATIAVQLTEPTPAPAPPPPRPKPRTTLQKAWHSAGHNILAVLRGVVLAVAWLAPVIVIGAVGGLALYLVWRRRRATGGRASGTT